MTWSAQVQSIANDPANGNINLTIVFTGTGGQTQTRVVPSSTWTPAAIASYVQAVIALLDARDAASAALSTGPAPPPATLTAALQSVWNTTILPNGVTGTALAAGDTAAQKIAKINAWTVAGASLPAIIPTYKIYNSIVSADFTSLTAANQQLVRDILSMGTVDASPSTQVRSVLQSIFAGKTTLTNLAALVVPFDSPPIPWWQSNGGTAAISISITTAAGLS